MLIIFLVILDFKESELIRTIFFYMGVSVQEFIDFLRQKEGFDESHELFQVLQQAKTINSKFHVGYYQSLDVFSLYQGR